MTEVIVGIDAGGTKCALRIETVNGVRISDVAYPADGWEAEPVDAAAAWLWERVERAAGCDAAIAAIGVGAQGCDTGELGRALGDRLSAHGAPAVVVNDGALLVPAAGYEMGIGVVAGTGSIAVGAGSDGAPLFAGGWGWVIGDDAGGPAIVREAAKAALSAHDFGRADDGLLAALLHSFNVGTAERLARAVNDDPQPTNWGPHAPAVFTAADEGSALAVGVIDAAAAHLGTLVDQLTGRGAVGDAVIAAGSVIVGQPRLFDAFTGLVATTHPSKTVALLNDDPVAGAVLLARRLLNSRRTA